MSNRFLLVLFLLFGILGVSAQKPQVVITGKILESDNNIPFEYATISFLLQE
jgi:hypothetical protein